MLEKDFASESRLLREAMSKIERQHVKELGELNIQNQQQQSQIKGLQRKLQDSYQDNEKLLNQNDDLSSNNIQISHYQKRNKELEIRIDNLESELTTCEENLAKT